MGNAGRQTFWKKTLILRVKGHIERLHRHLSGKLTVPIPLLEVRAVSLWQIVMYTGWSSSCSVCESPKCKSPLWLWASVIWQGKRVGEGAGCEGD